MRRLCAPLLLALLPPIQTPLPEGAELPAPIQLPRASAQEVSIETQLAGLVDEAWMQAEVRELCKLGPRMGGTPSGHRAAEHVAQRFRALGLDTRVVEDPPQWCHSEIAWKVIAHRGDERRELKSAWPYGFSPSSRGRAMLADKSAPGIALLTERAPRRAAAASESPAVVLVTANTTLDGAYPRISHLRQGPDNPCAVFGLNRADAEWLEAALKSSVRVEVEYELEARIEKSSPRTVVARLPGRDDAGPAWSAEHLLFSAHGDSDAGGPGADDNASGVATLLGIARAYTRAIETKLVPGPRRELRFAVWGSEIHSTRHLLSRGDSDGKVLAVINYDQAGFGSGADQFNIEPDDLPANVGLVHGVLGVLADHGGKSGFPARWATNKSLGGTDSYVFSDHERFREELRPALTLFTSAWDAPAEHPRTPGMPGESWRERDKVNVDYDNYYHSAGDTPENTTDKEPWNMGWCARIGLLSARRAVEAAR